MTAPWPHALEDVRGPVPPEKVDGAAAGMGDWGPETRALAGERVATNLTTGLLAYKVQEGLTDGVEGRAPDDLAAPAPDASAARDNPCRERLASLTAGEVLGGYPVTVSLALMAARDRKTPRTRSTPTRRSPAGLVCPSPSPAVPMCWPSRSSRSSRGLAGCRCSTARASTSAGRRRCTPIESSARAQRCSKRWLTGWCSRSRRLSRTAPPP